jgi:Putative rhamnosyl transferase
VQAVNHILLTRFNLPSAGVQSLIRSKDGWLRQRIELFERYCVPSVAAQSNRDFSWIVYFDRESPGWLRDRIAGHSRTGAFTPIFRESVSNEEIVSDIQELIDSERRDLLTTNLDNDDGIAADFIDRIQSAPTTTTATAIYMRLGLIRCPSGLYLHQYPRNAFNSVRGPWSARLTCWSEWHTDFDRLMPVVELDGPPGWLQVVHGSNVSNRVRGRLVSPTPYRQKFGQLLDGVAEPSSWELARDLLFSRPTRFMREFSRAAAKHAILTTLGRDGLDRVQVLWRSRAGLDRI